jgi:diaminopimelate decarboxylase
MPGDQELDIEYISRGIKKEHDEKIVGAGLPELKIFLECGRYITGPHGYLISRVRHVSSKYKDFVGVDACMSNLMRPALYNAYHEITVLGKEDATRDRTYDVTGYLCENNDKFAVDRSLPEVRRGDLIVIHDVGAHGYSMGFNYNGSLKSGEFLFTNDKTFKMIRRCERLEDYFSTLSFPGSQFYLAMETESKQCLSEDMKTYT